MAGSAMFKTVEASVECDLEVADAEKRQHLPEGVRIPDFFDHWMEEYACKIVDRPVAPDTGKHGKSQNPGHLGRKPPKPAQRKRK